MQMFAALGSLFSTGATAAGTAATAVGTVAPAATGISLSTILQGGLSILSAVSAINAGNAQADALEQQAQDAKREQPLETLQGIARRSSIKEQMMAAIGAQDVAYAASGTDLSFGTPGEARKDAFREADLGLETDSGTQITRQARLQEREANYLKMARKARQAGVVDALTTGIGGAMKINDTWGSNYGKQKG